MKMMPRLCSSGSGVEPVPKIRKRNCVFCLHKCICICVYGVCTGQKGAPDPLELELKIVVNHWKLNQQRLLTIEPSLQPQSAFSTYSFGDSDSIRLGYFSLSQSVINWPTVLCHGIRSKKLWFCFSLKQAAQSSSYFKTTRDPSNWNPHIFL